MINIIVAVAENGVIGAGGKIPWDFPEDRAYFKKITSGNIVIMGRNTFEDIGFPLPERYNIIISTTKNFHAENLTTAHDFESALEIARLYAEKHNINDIFLCGGRKIYQRGLDIADRIYLTKIYSDYTGDVFFPEFSRNDFLLAECTEINDISFCVYVRTDKEILNGK